MNDRGEIFYGNFSVWPEVLILALSEWRSIVREGRFSSFEFEMMFWCVIMMMQCFSDSWADQNWIFDSEMLEDDRKSVKPTSHSILTAPNMRGFSQFGSNLTKHIYFPLKFGHGLAETILKHSRTIRVHLKYFFLQQDLNITWPQLNKILLLWFGWI